LPDDESDWGKDDICKKVYNEINVHDKPIIFTVNGQYINGEHFTKLKHRGLHFLQYRLLVNIDLDNLGTEKYKFFTSDRSGIKDSELTNGFVDKVIEELCCSENLKYINNIITEKSMRSKFEGEFIKEIAQEIKSEYEKFLSPSDESDKFEHRVKPSPVPPMPPVYYDYIDAIRIANTKEKYKKDEAIRVTLITNAYQNVNLESKFYAYLDKKQIEFDSKNCMNGKVQFVFSKIKPGNHKLQFILFKGDTTIESNIYDFEVEEDLLKKNNEQRKLDLDLDIIPVGCDTEYIVDIVKKEKSIKVYIGLDNPMLDSLYHGQAIEQIKIELVKPVVMFVLFLKDMYENIQSVEERNKIVYAHIKSYLKS